MATYAATLYQPGQAAQQLTASQLALLTPRLTKLEQEPDFTSQDGLYLVATEQEVARLLNVHAVDLLATDNVVAVYGLANAMDHEAQDNPDAMVHVERYFFPCGDLAGPILVIEQTTSQTEDAQPAPTENAPQFYPTSTPTSYTDEHWPTYGEQRGRY